jgi:hypothetical protein
MRTAIGPCSLMVALALLSACRGGGGGGDDSGCHDASCVRDVTVTRLETTWNEDGTSSTAPAWDVETIAVDAIVVNGAGETRTIPAQRDGSRWVLRAVPGGPYRLRMTNTFGVQHFCDTTASDIDLGWDTSGRSDLVFPSVPTVATLQLSGLAPWISADHLQLVSWGARLWNAFEPPVTFATTSVNVPYDFASSGWYGSDPLLVAADRLDAVQFRASTATWGGWAAPVAKGSATAVSMAAGSPTSIPLAMVPVSPDRQVFADWKATRFEDHLGDMGAGANAASYPHWLYVTAAPLPTELSASIGAGTDLLKVWVPPGVDARTGALAYANVSPSVAYRERVAVSYEAEVARAAPGATPARLDVTIGREDPSIPAPITPLVTPPRSVRIAGRDATSPLAGVGTAPTISWLPPLVGRADTYVVTVVELYADAGETKTWTTTTVRTAATETTIPPGILFAGRTYVLVIDARAGSYTPEAPYRRGVPAGWAQTVTETFSP